MKNHVFCKYAEGTKKYSFERCYECKKTCPSISNILYGYVFKLPIIKQIINLKWELDYKKQQRDFEEDYISENESKSMKLIFAISACGSWQGLFRANDFEVIYHKDINKYSVSIETMFMFNDRKSTKDYLVDTLSQFTNFMNDNGFTTNYKLDLYCVFTNGYNINTKFNTLEECYSMFKLLVDGF